uniref:Reverse transcriptase Ty1/copia-type domain-containing protein n=1 Tax=Oryza brachyantha TaxID=4533 RepID=J3KUE7_ORYBR
MSTASMLSSTSAGTMSSTSSATSSESAGIFVSPFATISVRTHVHVPLESKNSNYNKWKALFLSLCGKFGLLDHINGAAPAHPDDPAWQQADCCIISWMYGSVSDDILDLAMEPDQTARQLWVAIQEMFYANKEPRAIFLSHAFHSLSQGDLSIADYCQHMKTAADALRDVGHPITESQLVFNLLRGVNPRFSGTADNIASAPVLQSFTSARNTLLLKELRIANEVKVQAQMALLAASSASSSSCTSSSCAALSASSIQSRGSGSNTGNNGNSNNNNKRRRGRNGGNGGGGGRQQSTGGGNQASGFQQVGSFFQQANQRPAGPWVFCFSPWAVQPQGWRSSGARLLGPYPQANIAFAGPYYSAPPAAASPPMAQPNWDQGVSTAVAPSSLGVEQPHPLVPTPSPKVETSRSVAPSYKVEPTYFLHSTGASSLLTPSGGSSLGFGSSGDLPASPAASPTRAPPESPIRAAMSLVSPYRLTYERLNRPAPPTIDHTMKSLYGLKQAPRAWYQRFTTYPRQLGFVASSSETSLFVYKDGDRMAYLLLYVDDIILTASSSALLQHLTARLHSEFAMTDLGDLHYFLGISVKRSSDGLFLSQRQYAVDLLQRAGMAECHSTSTPVDTRAKLSATDGAPVANPSEYRSLAGALQYLTLTRPDLAYAVQQVCLFMHDPREPHLALIKRILRYVKGSLSASLHIGTGPVSSVTAYSDADWAGCPDSRRSTSRYCVYLGDNLVSWSSKRQTTVSCSSAEAEYRAVAHAVAECCWLRQLLQELHVTFALATVVYCDNVSAVCMTANPLHHRRTKHIEIDIHFVHEKVALGQVRVLHVPSSHQFAHDQRPTCSAVH